MRKDNVEPAPEAAYVSQMKGRSFQMPHAAGCAGPPRSHAVGSHMLPIALAVQTSAFALNALRICSPAARGPGAASEKMTFAFASAFPGLAASAFADTYGLKMNWKKPAMSEVVTEGSNVMAWKRPFVSSAPSERAEEDPPGSKRWKRLLLSTVRAVQGEGRGANHLLWHSISIDEPTLSLIHPEETVMTDYKRNALDPQRIAKLAAQNCGCNGACYALFRPQQILSICRLWHALPDESQHHFLYAQWEGTAASEESADAVAHRTTWFFGGQRVCLSGLGGLLGSSKRSLLSAGGWTAPRRQIRDGLPYRQA